jgi:hypothetical protein
MCVIIHDCCAGELSAVVSKYDDSMLGLAQAMETLRQKMKEVCAISSKLLQLCMPVKHVLMVYFVVYATVYRVMYTTITASADLMHQI